MEITKNETVFKEEQDWTHIRIKKDTKKMLDDLKEEMNTLKVTDDIIIRILLTVSSKEKVFDFKKVEVKENE